MADDNTVTSLLDWLESLPVGTLIPPACVAERLRGAAVLFDGNGTATVPVAERPLPARTWRERVWTCPAETRLTAAEVAEELGWSTDKVYRYTSRKYADKQIAEGHPDQRLPFRRDVAGSLVFVAGEVGMWIENTEEVIAKPPESLSARLKVVGS